MKLTTREIALAGVFTALLCAVTIAVRSLQPIFMIPFSMQPFVIMLAACLLKPRAAFLSVLAYVLLGLAGLPVFSSPPYGGPGYVMMPTFGFILAFPFVALIQSMLIRRTSVWQFIIGGLAGVVVMYAIGVPYFYLLANFVIGKPYTVMKIIEIAFTPLIVFDIAKVVLASLLALELSKRLGIERNIPVKHDDEEYVEAGLN